MDSQQNITSQQIQKHIAALKASNASGTVSKVDQQRQNIAKYQSNQSGANSSHQSKTRPQETNSFILQEQLIQLEYEKQQRNFRPSFFGGLPDYFKDTIFSNTNNKADSSEKKSSDINFRNQTDSPSKKSGQQQTNYNKNSFKDSTIDPRDKSSFKSNKDSKKSRFIQQKKQNLSNQRQQSSNQGTLITSFSSTRHKQIIKSSGTKNISTAISGNQNEILTQYGSGGNQGVGSHQLLKKNSTMMGRNYHFSNNKVGHKGKQQFASQKNQESSKPKKQVQEMGNNLNQSIGENEVHHEMISSGSHLDHQNNLIASVINADRDTYHQMHTPENENDHDGSLGGEPDVLEITDDNDAQMANDQMPDQKTEFIDNRAQFLSNTYEKPKGSNSINPGTIEILSNDSNFMTLNPNQERKVSILLNDNSIVSNDKNNSAFMTLNTKMKSSGQGAKPSTQKKNATGSSHNQIPSLKLQMKNIIDASQPKTSKYSTYFKKFKATDQKQISSFNEGQQYLKKGTQPRHSGQVTKQIKQQPTSTTNKYSGFASVVNNQHKQGMNQTINLQSLKKQNNFFEREGGARKEGNTKQGPQERKYDVFSEGNDLDDGGVSSQINKMNKILKKKEKAFQQTQGLNLVQTSREYDPRDIQLKITSVGPSTSTNQQLRSQNGKFNSFNFNFIGRQQLSKNNSNKSIIKTQGLRNSNLNSFQSVEKIYHKNFLGGTQKKIEMHKQSVVSNQSINSRFNNVRPNNNPFNDIQSFSSNGAGQIIGLQNLAKDSFLRADTNEKYDTNQTEANLHKNTSSINNSIEQMSMGSKEGDVNMMDFQYHNQKSQIKNKSGWKQGDQPSKNQISSGQKRNTGINIKNVSNLNNLATSGWKTHRGSRITNTATIKGGIQGANANLIGMNNTQTVGQLLNKQQLKSSFTDKKVPDQKQKITQFQQKSFLITSNVLSPKNFQKPMRQVSYSNKKSDKMTTKKKVELTNTSSSPAVTSDLMPQTQNSEQMSHQVGTHSLTNLRNPHSNIKSDYHPRRNSLKKQTKCFKSIKEEKEKLEESAQNSKKQSMYSLDQSKNPLSTSQSLINLSQSQTTKEQVPGYEHNQISGDQSQEMEQSLYQCAMQKMKQQQEISSHYNSRHQNQIFSNYHQNVGQRKLSNGKNQSSSVHSSKIGKVSNHALNDSIQISIVPVGDKGKTGQGSAVNSANKSELQGGHHYNNKNIISSVSPKKNLSQVSQISIQVVGTSSSNPQQPSSAIGVLRQSSMGGQPSALHSSQQVEPRPKSISPPPPQPTYPLSTDDAIKLFGEKLNEYEKQEMVKFDGQIYYVGQNCKRKIKGHVIQDKANKSPEYLQRLKERLKQMSIFNHGYDDDQGDYQVILKDHLGYRYEVLKFLGQGSFGQAIMCKDHKTEENVAVKIIRNKKKFQYQAGIELKILKYLNHHDKYDQNNVIRIKDYFVFRKHLMIAFECLSINLYEFIKNNNFQGVSQGLIRRFAIQILQALKYQRDHNIVHCDLKPENILLKQQNKSGIKVIDYGSSCFNDQRIYTYIQSRFYRAPEIILGIPYTTAIDMWSFGCIVAELYTGFPLFPGENEIDQLAYMMEICGVPEDSVIETSTRKHLFFEENNEPIIVPNSRGKKRLPNSKTLEKVLKTNDEKFISFLKGCFVWHPVKRFTPLEALHHEWILEGLPEKVLQHHKKMFNQQDDKRNLKKLTHTDIQGFPPDAQSQSIYDIVDTIRMEDEEREHRRMLQKQLKEKKMQDELIVSHTLNQKRRSINEQKNYNYRKNREIEITDQLQVQKHSSFIGEQNNHLTVKNDIKPSQSIVEGLNVSGTKIVNSTKNSIISGNKHFFVNSSPSHKHPDQLSLHKNTRSDNESKKIKTFSAEKNSIHSNNSKGGVRVSNKRVLNNQKYNTINHDNYLDKKVEQVDINLSESVEGVGESTPNTNQQMHDVYEKHDEFKIQSYGHKYESQSKEKKSSNSPNKVFNELEQVQLSPLTNNFFQRSSDVQNTVQQHKQKMSNEYNKTLGTPQKYHALKEYRITDKASGSNLSKHSDSEGDQEDTLEDIEVGQERMKMQSQIKIQMELEKQSRFNHESDVYGVRNKTQKPGNKQDEFANDDIDDLEEDPDMEMEDEDDMDMSENPYRFVQNNHGQFQHQKYQKASITMNTSSTYNKQRTNMIPSSIVNNSLCSNLNSQKYNLIKSDVSQKTHDKFRQRGIVHNQKNRVEYQPYQRKNARE